MVYLAGPITGLTLEEATIWRDFAIRQFALYDIEGMSPMRDPQHVFSENVKNGRYSRVSPSVQRAIFMRDHNDCKNADALLVNLLHAKTVSTGTVMEIAWAYAYGVPLVVVRESEGNPHMHCMLDEACPVIVETVTEGIDVVLSILLANPHGS